AADGICRGAGVGAHVRMAQVPVLDGVAALAEAGYVTGASARNWSSYGAEVELDPELEGVPKALLCDPQTSGGLLVACAGEAVAEVMETFERTGFTQTAVIGRTTSHPGRTSVMP